MVYGLSADRLVAVLNRRSVDSLFLDYYRFNDLDNSELKLISDSLDIQIPKNLLIKIELEN